MVLIVLANRKKETWHEVKERKRDIERYTHTQRNNYSGYRMA